VPGHCLLDLGYREIAAREGGAVIRVATRTTAWGDRPSGHRMLVSVVIWVVVPLRLHA
jgi:hypothetical protein